MRNCLIPMLRSMCLIRGCAGSGAAGGAARSGSKPAPALEDPTRSEADYEAAYYWGRVAHLLTQGSDRPDPHQDPRLICEAANDSSLVVIQHSSVIARVVFPVPERDSYMLMQGDGALAPLFTNSPPSALRLAIVPEAGQTAFYLPYPRDRVLAGGVIFTWDRNGNFRVP